MNATIHQKAHLTHGEHSAPLTFLVNPRVMTALSPRLSAYLSKRKLCVHAEE